MWRRGSGILLFILGWVIYTPSYAQVRDLEGIDIISREEWGATESWTWLDGGSRESFRVFLTQYESWLVNGGDDPGGKFAARKARNELQQKRRGFLEVGHRTDVHIDETITLYDAYQLVRPRQYHYDKTKIVIHHTAGSQVYDTPEKALQGVRDIYEFHTLTRGWGDVGYNFLIDPYGNIYEGRAGGKSVVGGHTDWNNVSTIGIALMGNFDRDEPTAAARESLVRLTTSLAVEYDIDPYQRANYFTAINEEPWLSVHRHDSIIGHQDAKNTGCPGEHVYERLPALKQQVTELLSFIDQAGTSEWSTLHFIDEAPAVYAEDTLTSFSVILPHGGKLSCQSLDTNVAVTDCAWRAGTTVQLTIAHDGFPASGKKTFIVTAGSDHYVVSPTIVWEKDIDLLAQQRQQSYESTHGQIQSSSTSEKISKKIPVSAIDDLREEDVRVLLYDASTTLSSRRWSCPDGCDVELDDTTVRDVENVEVLPFDGELRVFIDGESTKAGQVRLLQEGMIVLDNYERPYAGLEMNVFRGDIIIERQSYKHLDHGWREDYVIINKLPLDDYLAGVGEISEQQHIEKLKAMALLVKGYTFFYLDGANEHPSIPDDGAYNAVDDPRIFQKYLGANFEIYGKQRLQVLAATQDEYVVYDDYLPILPYFHCSAGFTKSARDYFGWTDTPWLVTKLDVVDCIGNPLLESGTRFEGHGVGLSGDGAEAMARAGMNYQQIIKWWYEGVEVEKL